MDDWIQVHMKMSVEEGSLFIIGRADDSVGVLPFFLPYRDVWKVFRIQLLWGAIMNVWGMRVLRNKRFGPDEKLGWKSCISFNGISNFSRLQLRQRRDK